MLYFLLILPPGLLWLFRQRLQPVLQSPVWVCCLIITSLTAVAYTMRERLANIGGGSIRGQVTAEMAFQTVKLVGISMTAFVLGAILVLSVKPAPVTTPTKLHPVAASEKVRPWLLPAALFPLLAIVFGSSPSELIHRSLYLRGAAGSNVAALGAQLAIGAIAVLGYVAASERGGRRTLAVLAAVAYIILFFALGSRRITLMPVCFGLGVYAASMSRQARTALIVTGALSLLTLPLPLYLRSLPAHGLGPYTAALPDFFNGDVAWLSTINNVLIFFRIVAFTAFSTEPIPVHHLLVELNPLPGSMVGWYEVNRQLMLNNFTPYAGVGELRNVGWDAVLTVWFGIGVILAVFDGHCRRLMLEGRQVAAVGIVGLTGLFSVTVLQYNLRSGMRSLVYASLVIFVLHWWKIRQMDSQEEKSVPSRTIAVEKS